MLGQLAIGSDFAAENREQGWFAITIENKSGHRRRIGGANALVACVNRKAGEEYFTVDETKK